ncbi:sigma-70 family RNA polymerase sigma factor [Paludisphaera mucosa]|uniref:Sigma-70 family RNA polymerase sigma factor n=1 Tax=Paludisphaera mucosa TaxID=3030827 RepID=A0ABT6FLH9_9BACT|nr:sigma-70 family RNA polymerase sigma factor [Paludisphaera mucosa]MDG3008430.1 sigma-70 family RNA polymerase sigma factor [Paludisphaera mucosa]
MKPGTVGGVDPLRVLFHVGSVGGMTDGDLLRTFASRRGEAGAEAAFAALVERHGPLVLRVCRGVVGDPHSAEDAFQATFLLLARRAGSIRRPDAVAGWLFRIARRIAAKSRADVARRKALERRGAEMAARRADVPGRTEAGAELYEELDRLPEKYREPIVLCHLSGLTYEEAAMRLGCPVRTVHTRLIRGRERLRRMLVRRGAAPSAGLLALSTSADAAGAGVPRALASAATRAAVQFVAGRSAVPSSTAVAMAESMLGPPALGRWKAAFAAATLCGAVAVCCAHATRMLGGRGVDGAPTPSPRLREAGRDDVSLQGRWSASIPGPEGRPQVLVWAIERDALSIWVASPDGVAEDPPVEARLVVDRRSNPKTFAIVHAISAAGPLEDNLGIYELDGDSLKICYGTPGMPRPSSFREGVAGPPRLLVLGRGGPAPRPLPSPTSDRPAEVDGVVLGPDGRPFAGAKVYFDVPDDARAGEEPRARKAAEVAASGPDGRFRFRAEADAWAGVDRASPLSRPTVSALADGFGPAWVSCQSPSSASNVELRLVEDDVPISGKLLDAEGRPVPDAEVRVLGLRAVRGDDLGAFVRAFERTPTAAGALLLLGGRLDVKASGLVPSVRTGPDGRFHLEGVGRGRVVELRIAGPGVATQKLVAAPAGPTPPGAPRRAVKRPEPGVALAASAAFDVVAARSRSVEGVVFDGETGRAIAGVAVKSDRVSQGATSADDFIRTTTDERGRYRLDGLPDGPGNSIVAAPAGDQPYLASLVEVGLAPDGEPTRVDFALRRGVLVRGRVTSGSGRLPVRARVQYFADPSNPHADEAPGFGGTRQAAPTEPDGSFAVAALPGRGLLAVRAGGRFAPADARLERRPRLPSLLDGRDADAVVMLDLDAAGPEVRRDVVLESIDRSNPTAVGQSGPWAHAAALVRTVRPLPASPSIRRAGP